MDSFVFNATVSSPRSRAEVVHFPDLSGAGPYSGLLKGAKARGPKKARPSDQRPKTTATELRTKRPETQQANDLKRRKRAWEDSPKVERAPWNSTRWTSTDAIALDAKQQQRHGSAYAEQVYVLPGPRRRRKRSRDRQRVRASTSLPRLKFRLKEARDEVKREAVSIEDNVRAIKQTLPKDFLFQVGMRSFVLERGIDVLQRFAKRMVNSKAGTAFKQWVAHTEGESRTTSSSSSS